jgi:farnesyl-diphosphate farnesyltransferase
MVVGMRVYAARFDARGPIRDETDLVRYCHFVAGTVGQLLTDLFALGSDRVREREPALRAEAESFGLLLQLTNIAKDLEEDLARGTCFVPQSILQRRRVAREELFAPLAAHRTRLVVRDLVGMARAYLPAAHRYVDALPAEELSIRQFCTLPLSLATRTLDVLDSDPTAAVRKVDRATVMAIVADVHAMGMS